MTGMEKSTLLSAGLSSSLSLLRIKVENQRHHISIALPQPHTLLSQLTSWLQISPQLVSLAAQDCNQNLSGISSMKANKHLMFSNNFLQTQKLPSALPKVHEATTTSCDPLNAGYPTWQVTVWVCVAVHLTPSVCEGIMWHVILVQKVFMRIYLTEFTMMDVWNSYSYFLC